MPTGLGVFGHSSAPVSASMFDTTGTAHCTDDEGVVFVEQLDVDELVGTAEIAFAAAGEPSS